MNCLTEDQLLLLLDGGIAPNQVEGIYAHIARCSTCRAAMTELEALAGDLAEPVAYDEEAHVQRVMGQLDNPREGARSGATRTMHRWRLLLGGGVSTLAVAAGVALFVHGQDARVDDSSFAARGSKDAPTLERNVGVRVFTGKDSLVRLTNGAKVSSGAPFSAVYTNVHPRPVHLLLFAVDAENTVHWLYPAYTNAHENPASIALEPTGREQVLPTSVVLDAPARGALRFVSVVTESPLRVSDIEHRATGELAQEALKHAFPKASISELQVRVENE